MIKVYSKENYKDWNDFRANLINELSSSFVGHDVDYRGFVLSIKEFKFETVYFDSVAEDVVKVWFEDESYLVFFRAVNAGILNFLDENDTKVYKEFKAVVEDAKMVHAIELKEERARLAEAQRIAYQEYLKREAEKAERLKQKEAEKKFQAKIERSLRKLNTLRPEKVEKLFNSPSNYYEAIGWMAKHTSSIRAAMPDYMEKWFDERFDCDYKYIVDSKKRTSGGHPVQWGLSFKMSFDEAVSGVLEARATSQNKKVIDNVAFVWDLIENYGFQFTKNAQDIDKIRAEIPNQYVSDFEKGLAM